MGKQPLKRPLPHTLAEHKAQEEHKEDKGGHTHIEQEVFHPRASTIRKSIKDHMGFPPSVCEHTRFVLTLGFGPESQIVTSKPHIAHP